MKAPVSSQIISGSPVAPNMAGKALPLSIHFKPRNIISKISRTFRGKKGPPKQALRLMVNLVYVNKINTHCGCQT